MGKVNEESYFPRGRSSTSKPALRKKKDSLFKKPKKTKKKNTFYEGVTKKSKDEFKFTGAPEIKHVIKPLTYQMLEEGMVLVGRVREVLPYHMFVCLPGRLSAKVTVTGISAPYTESVTRLRGLEITEQECPPLTEMFRPGQCVVCSVVEVKKDGDLLAVTASLDPALVNASRSHNSVGAGHTLMAAVRSIEDHGYTLHTGVSNLTTFLRFKEAESYVKVRNGGRKLAVGEVVRCLVTKCANAKNSSRAEVTLDPGRVARAVTEDITSQTVQPGTTVRCTVIQPLASGLVVALGNGKGYVEASQLTESWSSPEDFPPYTELRAHVLYTLPQVDFQMSAKPVYLTLNNIHSVVTPRIAVGEVSPALVVNSGFKGVWLCLGEKKDNSTGNKGFVTSRRLGEDVKREEVADKFPRGKKVTARVLAYDYMERIYNCSLEREKLEQEYLKLSQLSVGDRVTCQVSSVEENGLGLTLGLLRLYAFKEHCADIPHADLNQHFIPGDIVDARVLKITETQAQVTLKETLIRFPALTSYDMAHKNDSYWGVIRHVKESHLYVVFYDNVGGALRLVKPHPTYVPGQLVKCFVNYVNAPKEKLMLSAAPEGERTKAQLSVGDQYQLVVTQVLDQQLKVSACDYDDCDGLIPKCHLPEPCTYQEGDFLKAWLYLDRNDKLYFSPHPAILDFVKRREEVEVNSKVTCCVANFSRQKVVVFTPMTKYSLVSVPRKKWFKDGSAVMEHQLVEMSISNYDSDSKKIKLECSDSDKLRNKSTGRDEETSDYFTDDNTSKPDGPTKEKRKRKQEESKNACPSNDLKNAEPLGKKKKLSDLFDFKPASKDVQEAHESNLSEISLPKKKKEKKKKSKKAKEELKNERNDTSKPVKSEVNENANKKKKKKTQSIEDNKKESPCLKASSDEDENEPKVEKVKKPKVGDKNKPKSTLSETGFFWDVKPEDLNKPEEEIKDDSDEEEDEGKEGKKRKRGNERRQAAREEEARLREVERTLLETESAPQSADQFDRAALARPDDADLWIKYMSHHLQATEIEKARAVARRALNTINQRFETERLNVWIALLNLENLFGTQESLKSTLDEALRTNDEFTVYSKMLQIYAQAKKSQNAEHLVGVMLRKFRSSPQCWLQSCSALMACEAYDKARNILQRAVTALPNKEHVNLLCKFALLENQHGFGEQAQTLFEHILTSYPKRTDIWNVYVDMLVKSDKLDVARQVLGRATKQKLPARKMKMLFSKWISLEERLGSTETVENVKKLALAYVNNITKSLES